MLRTVLAFLADAPPMLCDWLPWNHTFGGNHNFGIVLYNGGTLYIDEGRPVPDGFGPTIAQPARRGARPRTSTCRADSRCCCPPFGRTRRSARHFFSRLAALFFAAAGLRQRSADGMQELAIDASRPARCRGSPASARPRARRLRCAPAPLLSTTTHVGVPVPGLELKARPVGGVLEARLRGPNITPGYWRDEDSTRAAFDEEGFYRMGDAIAPVDPDDPCRGASCFDGRMQRGLQALDRHLGARRSAARAAPRGAGRHRAGCRHHRARPRRVAVADLSEPDRLPDARCRHVVYRRCICAHPPWCGQSSPSASRATTRPHPGSSTAVVARRAARHAAVPRRGGNHRQGIDQPARRARAAARRCRAALYARPSRRRP